jgi:hypothetical protein
MLLNQFFKMSYSNHTLKSSKIFHYYFRDKSITYPFSISPLQKNKMLNCLPSGWGLLDFIRVVLLLPRVLLFFSSSSSWSVFFFLQSLPTSKLNTHYWTTSWDLPKSMQTTGPQPGTHRSTSACNLPSPRRTAGPQ